MEKHPLHIKNPELQSSSDVDKAVKRHERLSGEKVPNNPFARIETYMDRLENVFLHPDQEKRQRNLDMLRPRIYDALLIKKEDFPESHFELQQRVARERGQAVEVIPENVREQMMDTAIQDQQASLDAWIDYLSSDDAVYPPWFKYYVWKNVTKLSQFDKERGEFRKRTASTVAPFPDIYREPLAQMADLYEKVKADNKTLSEPEVKELFSKKFPSLYAELIQKSLATKLEHKEQVQGTWVKYAQGNPKDADKLFKSLENKGTGWCTAGHATAEAQIQSGDFHVYYTNDAHNEPTQPRLAIRMQGRDKLAEVRGILPNQNVEPLLQETLDEKLKTFGKEADAYRKKSADMKQLTAVEHKMGKDEPLTKEDLVFLYELDAKIEGFGYGRDPRIKELRAKRDPKKDAPIILDCDPKDIATSKEAITPSTKAYIGPLFPGVFEKYPHLEHLYTSFPEGEDRRRTLELGGKTPKEYEKELTKEGHQMSDWAKQILLKVDTPKETQEIDTIRLKVSDLGFSGAARHDELCARAKELGLELSPAEVGPALRLALKDQPMKDRAIVAMKAIAVSDGNPHVFNVVRYEDGSWLNAAYGDPVNQWDPVNSFVFRLRKH